MVTKLKIMIQKARDGRDYVQILSDDMTSVNIVLIAEEIEVEDTRIKKSLLELKSLLGKQTDNKTST